MSDLQTTTPDQQTWDAFVEQASGHLLQTSAWGQHKTEFGWQAERVALVNQAGNIISGALVLYRRLPMGLGTLAYVPRGPLGDWGADLIAALDKRARARRAVLLKLEPNEEDTSQARERMQALGFQLSPQTVQPPRSIVIDIAPDEDAILANMHQKWRYNVRLAGRKEISVRRGDAGDLASFNQLMGATGERNEFGVHGGEYYRRAFELFARDGKVALLMASYAGRDLAGLMVFAQGQTASYLYGASSDEERNRMPTYLLQWEAIRWARERDCTLYDLWGVPDADEETLEAQFANRSDGLWGVYRFKRGFGGRLVRTLGAWDRMYRPGLYALYKLRARI